MKGRGMISNSFVALSDMIAFYTRSKKRFGNLLVTVF